jgi:hypothetical protein
MKVISMHKVDAAMEAGKLPSQELIQGMGKLMGDMRRSNALVDGAGLRPSATRVRVRSSAGKRALEKGPYKGEHELLAGMLRLQVKDMEEALAWASRYAEAAGDVELEVGPITEAWDLGIMAKPENAPLNCLLLRKADANTEAGRPHANAAAMAKVTAEMKRAGVLTGSERLEPSKQGVRIKVTNKRSTIVDGPFAESKELIAGFVVMDVPSLADAQPWCLRFAEVIGDVEMDLRVLAEPEGEP